MILNITHFVTHHTSHITIFAFLRYERIAARFPGKRIAIVQYARIGDLLTARMISHDKPGTGVPGI